MPQNEPLPLSDLRAFVSEDTFEWLEDAEEKERSWQKIQKAMQRLQDQASQVPESIQTGTNVVRIQEWTSSLKHPDGYGGFERRDDTTSAIDNRAGKTTEDEDGHDNITVKYILSGDVWQGFGNQVWAASRHLANMLADPIKCRVLLDPSLSNLFDNDHTSTSSTKSLDKVTQHPLEGICMCELGTGAGIPSWIAMRRGARVVSLDQAIPGRIRAVAECAQRNWQDVVESDRNDVDGGPFFHRPVISPYDWGNPVEDITDLLKQDGQDRFDVLVAADCLFMPWFHSELLESIDLLLSDRGVAILTFPLHGNVEDEQIWSFVDQANEKGFTADQPFPPLQLTPQTFDMDLRQAFVYTLRLRKQVDP